MNLNKRGFLGFAIKTPIASLLIGSKQINNQQSKKILQQKKSFQPCTNEVLPPGEYLAVIDEAEMRDFSGGRFGQFLKLKFKIVEGMHKGRFIYDQIVLSHHIKVAEEIGRSRLSRLCNACFLKYVSRPSELVGHKLLLLVGVEAYNGKEYNRVSGWRRYYAKKYVIEEKKDE